MTASPRPLCDRCRAEAAAPAPASPDALQFDPVPRKSERVDGWSAERQRAFIAALAVTGSPRRAAAAVGKSVHGVEQLRKAPGAESFAAAWDAAIAIARDTGSRRLAAGVGAVRAENAAWAPPPAPWSGAATRRPATAAPEPEPSEEDRLEAKLEWLGGIVRKYMLKLGQERTSRLAGEIVTADYYLRQLTFIEVLLDLMSDGGGFELLARLRAGEPRLIDVAETPLSKLLGEARRAKWAELGEPPRPEHPPRRYLEQHDGHATEPLEYTWSGREQSHQEQWQAFEERHARDAAAQVEWEALARRDYEDRRDSGSSS